MDPISNMLNQIKTAQAVRHEQVLIPFSKMKFAIANVLVRTGYIASVERKKKKVKKTEHEYLLLTLKYVDGSAAISGIRMISRQSRRMYLAADEIKPVRSGLGLSVLSTSKGVMSSHDARKARVGGEIICEIW